MTDNLKVINFLQDFGCAKLKHLQKLYDLPNDNFNNVLKSNMVSKKGDIFVHNTAVIDYNMLSALDALCKYKGRFKEFQKGNQPIYITFLSKDNNIYHIIVAAEGNEKGLIKKLNTSPPLLPKADKLILLFKNREDIQYINCEIPYLYCIYPSMEVINT